MYGREHSAGRFRRRTLAVMSRFLTTLLATGAGSPHGMTTGEPVVVKLAMKPIATLMAPLATVDLQLGEPAKAVSERSDVTAVPAQKIRRNAHFIVRQVSF